MKEQQEWLQEIVDWANEFDMYHIPREEKALLTIPMMQINCPKMMTYIPENIGNLTQLIHIQLIFLNIKYLPESMGNLSSLKVLQIIESNLAYLPESMGNLSALTTLEIDSTLTCLPESIGNLSALTTLKINNSNLTL